MFIPPLNSTAATGLNPACPAVTLDGSAFTAAVPNCTSPNPPTIAVFNEGIHGVVVMSQAACTLESYFWANSFQVPAAAHGCGAAAPRPGLECRLQPAARRAAAALAC